MADAVIYSGPDRAPQVRMRTTGWTRERRQRFLDVLAASANVALAARAVGVGPGSAWALRKRDHVFAELFAEAMAQGYDALEGALLERARGGVNAIEVEGLPLTLTGDAEDRRLSHDAARIVGGRVEMDVKLAMWLLERQDKRGARALAGNAMLGPAPSRAAVEAKIARKLDALAKRPKK